MRRPSRLTLSLLPLSLLTLSLLLLAACQTADRGLPTVTPTITQSPNPTITPTPTETPAPPTLTELGLSSELQQILESRQGWTFRWDASRQAYVITQKKWDADKAAFTSATVGEIGYIDKEAALHLHSSSFTAVPGTNSAFETRQTHDEVILDLKSLPTTPAPEATATPDNQNNAKETQYGPFAFIDTKNPLFEKTGILKFTTPDGKTYVYSASSALTSEQTIDGKKLKVVEFASLEANDQGVMAFSLDTLHTGFPAAWLIANGYDKPFSEEALKNFPTWAIQFHYHPETATKDAVLWPRSGKTAEYFRYLEDQNKNIVWFFVTDEQGNSFFTLPFLTLNPKDSNHPQADETMFIFGALGKMDPTQYNLFKYTYLDSAKLKEILLRQTSIYLAQEGGYFEKNAGAWDAYFDQRPLDKLLGMEKKIMENIYYGPYNFDFSQDFKKMEANGNKVEEYIISMTDENGNLIILPIPYKLQKVVLGVGF